MPNASKTTSKRRTVVGIAVLLVVMGGLAVGLISVYRGQSLPDASEISRMTAQLRDAETQQQITHEISEVHWKSVLEALGPGKHVFSHAKWKDSGRLKLTTTGSDIVIVSLFRLEGGRTGYSVKTEDGKETFYLGGDSKPLMLALQEAINESKNAP